VLGPEHLPLPPDSHLSFTESLVSVRQHLREGSQCCFRFGARSERSLEDNLRSLQTWRWDRAGRTSHTCHRRCNQRYRCLRVYNSRWQRCHPQTPAGTWGPEGVASAVTGGSWGSDGATSVPTSPCTVEVNAAGASSATANVRLGTEADEAAEAADGSPAMSPADVCSWEPGPPAGAVAEGGRASI
jgi:hypothetical protein